ncbi:hypothetical protein CR513_46235, partial [Mucuna pruriens]
MYPSDKEKTSFMTEGPNYCYQVMSSGLKNVGATYQKLMDKVETRGICGRHGGQIHQPRVPRTGLGRNLIPSQEVQHEAKLGQLRVLGTGREVLGFMLAHRGIEANPNKYEAIISMKNPQNVKEVQQLIGRLASLSQFLTRAIEKAQPFFQLLRNLTTFH